MLVVMLYVVKVLNDDIMPTLNKLREVSDAVFIYMPSSITVCD